jgi:O-antigen ligase
MSDLEFETHRHQRAGTGGSLEKAKPWDLQFQKPLLSRRLLPVSIPVPSVKVPKLVYWAFILFAFSIPFEAAELLFAQRGALTLARVAGFGLIASYVLYLTRCLTYPHRSIWWIIVYFMICLLHGLTIPTQYINELQRNLIFMAQFFIIFWITARLFKEEKCARVVLIAFSIATVLMALGALLGIQGFSAAIKENITTTRLTVAEGTNPNYTAYISGLAAIILVGFMLNKSAQSLWRKISLMALTVPLFAVTVATGSRTGMAGLLLGLSIYALPLGRSRRKLTALIWGTLAIATIVFLSFANPTSSSRWDKTLTSKSNARFEIWSLAVGVIADRPIFGWGPVMNEVELGRREGRNKRNTHNFLLHLFSTGGIIGGGAFLVGIGVCAQEAWRARAGNLGLIPLALMITLILNNLTQPWLFRRPTWFVLGLVVAAVSFRSRGKYIIRIVRNCP